MTTNDRAASDEEEGAAQPLSRFFVVRLWTEEMAAGREYRGTAQEVTSRAFCNFRNWSDLTAFMIARMEEDACARAEGAKGGMA